MAHLYEALPSAQKGAWAESSGELRDALLASVRPGDVLMVKGSLGSRWVRLPKRCEPGSGLRAVEE